jgi:hypothetical protein
MYVLFHQELRATIVMPLDCSHELISVLLFLFDFEALHGYTFSESQ